jgi:transcriptional regulator
MTLYLPEKFKGAEWQEIVRDFPLATVITPGAEDGPHVSHLPLLLEKRGEGDFLLGHLARANSHWRVLAGEKTVAVFHGPQAYISPVWYEQCDVPTWNYLVVHLRGQAKLLGEQDAVPALRKLSEKMEGEGGWEFHIPPARKDTLHQAIVAFEIPIESCQVKFKLSQNRSAADQAGVVRGLQSRGSESDLAVARWMEKQLPLKS